MTNMASRGWAKAIERYNARKEKEQAEARQRAKAHVDWRHFDGPKNFTKAEGECLRCRHLTAIVGQPVTCVVCTGKIEVRQHEEKYAASYPTSRRK